MVAFAGYQTWRGEPCLSEKVIRFPRTDVKPPCMNRSKKGCNRIERLFGKVKKRSQKMAAAFRNEDSCMLIFYAVICSL
jgi:hypothetical protein